MAYEIEVGVLDGPWRATWIVDVFLGDEHLFQESAASEELALDAARGRLAGADEAAPQPPPRGTTPTARNNAPVRDTGAAWLQATVTHTGIANPARVDCERHARYEIIIANSGATPATLYQLGRDRNDQRFNKGTLVAALHAGLITVTMPDGTVYSQTNCPPGA